MSEHAPKSAVAPLASTGDIEETVKVPLETYLSALDAEDRCITAQEQLNDFIAFCTENKGTDDPVIALKGSTLSELFALSETAMPTLGLGGARAVFQELLERMKRIDEIRTHQMRAEGVVGKQVD